MTPQTAKTWARRVVLVALAGVLWWGLSDLRFRRVEGGDWSTPGFPPGSLLFVTDALEEGEWIRDCLYFATYPANDNTVWRLVRLVGLPGDTVEVVGSEVRVAGRAVALHPHEVAEWPAIVPEDEAVVLTDQSASQTVHPVHPDSRALGPVPLRMLRQRVAGWLPF